MPGSTVSSTAVNLSRLPVPDVVEPLSYEAILADLLADLAVRLPDLPAPLESDPLAKVLEIVAWRELILRQRVNDGAHAVMLAYATGADLDHLAALFGVSRAETVPADLQAGTPAQFEADDDLRRRVLLAPDSYSVAGPASAYVFHALTADGEVLDASATSPAPGEVVVSVLARTGDGTASAELLAQVESVLSADDVRPLTDSVTVQSAGIVPFEIEAELTVYPGPDSDLILTTSIAALDALLAEQRRIGRDVTRSALIAALHTGGVQNVALIQPAADVVVSDTQAAAVATIAVTIAGTGE